MFFIDYVIMLGCLQSSDWSGGKISVGSGYIGVYKDVLLKCHDAMESCHGPKKCVMMPWKCVMMVDAIKKLA